jgi:hypothetical protein
MKRDLYDNNYTKKIFIGRLLKKFLTIEQIKYKVFRIKTNIMCEQHIMKSTERKCPK